MTGVAGHEGSDAPLDDAAGDAPDAAAAAGDAPARDGDAGDLADASAPDASCTTACKRERPGVICHADEVSWVCQGSFAARQPFIAACRDPGTDAIRYCCPPSFLAMCP
jgi:hypothetical protein